MSTDEIKKLASHFVETLGRFPAPKPIEPLLPAPPTEFEHCKSPSTGTPPQFLVPFRRAVVFPDLCLPVNTEGSTDPDQPLRPLPFNCVKPTGVTFCLSLDLRFEQTWNLTELSIGDLSSTMALAPAEELTLEFQNTQRRVLEESRVDSAEEMNSTESTTIDKEVVNTVQSLSKTQEWHVDGSASFGIPNKLSIGANAGFRRSTTETSQTTINHTSEVTKKSAHNLKTLHKIEVRGISEGLVQNRLTRKIKNPYPDRTLSLNVFQLLKHFDVQTLLAEIRPVFLIQIQGLTFDSDFVLSNTDFLQETLLDPALVDNLSIAVAGSRPQQSIAKARDAAKKALKYLFDDIIIFNIPGFQLPRLDGGPPKENPSNSIEVGFDTGLIFTLYDQTDISHQAAVDALCLPPSLESPERFGNFPAVSGIREAVKNNLGVIFTTLGFFYKFYKDTKAADPNETLLDEQAIALTSAIANSAGKQWTKIVEVAEGQLNDNDSINKVLRQVLDNYNFTEIFRRLSGFVAMVQDMVTPVGGTPEQEWQAVQEQEKALQTLERLLQHLQCNNNYYTQQYLVYHAAKTKNQVVVDFVNDVLNRVSDPVPALAFVQRTAMDVEHAFIDKQQIVVPGLHALTADQITELGTTVGSPDGAFSFEDIKPAVLKDVQVPADGVHLEVAQGDCILADVPPQPRTFLDVTVHHPADDERPHHPADDERPHH